MLLSDILTHVRNEVDSVRTPDVILALNEFMRIHKVDKRVKFHLKEALTGDSEITVLENDGQVLKSSFKYDSPLVEYEVNLNEDRNGFMLPNTVMTIKRMWLNGVELFSSLSTDPLFSNNSYYKYTIMPNNEVVFNTSISTNDTIVTYSSMIIPAYLYNQPETTDIPYNEGAYTCIVSYILYNLFKNHRYSDNDKASFYFGQYKANLSSLYPVRTIYRENMGVL